MPSWPWLQGAGAPILGAATTPFDSDPEYRTHIGRLAAAVWAQPPRPVCTMAQVIEYKAHLTLERLYGTIDEKLFDRAMSMAAGMEQRILQARRRRELG